LASPALQQSLQFLTSRLILAGSQPALLQAELAGRRAFAAALGVAIPKSWPPEHHDRGVIDWGLKSLEVLFDDEPWRMYYMVAQQPLTAIGTCGFHGPPDLSGCVEVGYTVLPEFRGRGLASEAVMTLISIGFEYGALEVAAETYPALAPSLRVMQKCGMSLVGAGASPGTVRYSVRRQ
jgi:ribosomal-protein-alanine N-acetyltransferase